MSKKKIIKKTKKPTIKKQVKKLETKVTKLLDNAKVKYKTLEHRVVFTAHDVGATTKKKLSEIAKVVLVKADKDFVLIVLPAGKYVDLKAVQKALASAKGGSASGGKKVSIASEKDITKYLKTKVGLLHPFGSEYNLQTLLDKGMARSKKMIASAGTFTDSVEVGLKDFQKMVKPMLGNFAKSKK
jgi:prolyl-tRNA editing enzyme YbaK/EbsC (Cys-tRNA(Pro) deacylase)